MLRPRNRARIDHLVERIALRRSIKIYRFANVGNHLHFLIQAPTRKALQGFLREITGAIASFITGAKKGNALQGRFWDQLAWSRVVHWGRDFLRASLYVVANLFEAAGYLTPAQKKQGLRPFRIASRAMRP